MVRMGIPVSIDECLSAFRCELRGLMDEYVGKDKFGMTQAHILKVAESLAILECRLITSSKGCRRVNCGIGQLVRFISQEKPPVMRGCEGIAREYFKRVPANEDY